MRAHYIDTGSGLKTLKMCYVYDVAEENKSFDSVIKAWFLQQQHLKLVKLFSLFLFSRLLHLKCVVTGSTFLIQ